MLAIENFKEKAAELESKARQNLAILSIRDYMQGVEDGLKWAIQIVDEHKQELKKKE